MAKSLTRYYQKEKKRVIEKCKECGVCAKKCPIIKKTELADVSSQDIQKQIKAYLETRETNQIVFDRAFSCMECFKCVDKCCPEGLNPLLVNEIIKWEYRQNKIEEMVYDDPKAANSARRVLASIQTSPEEYLKITSPSDKDTADYVFFPGCNVYWQPEKLLSALNIMDHITDDWAFVPGLDFCCGNVHIYCGAIEKAEKTSMALIEKLGVYNPDIVIFWCPTCLCRIHTTISHATRVPFEMISFPQFLARHIESLSFKNKMYSVSKNPNTVLLL